MTEKDDEVDRRIGKRMRSMLENLNEAGGVMSSKRKLAQASMRTDNPTSYGYEPINRLIRRDLVEVFEDHDEAEPKGSGAVVITEKGVELAEYFN